MAGWSRRDISSIGAPASASYWLVRRGAHKRMLSLDVPSGLDPDTGVAAPGAIRSRATMTLALPKVGLLREEASDRIGRLYLADIGLPAALYARMDLSGDAPFAAGQIVRLEDRPG